VALEIEEDLSSAKAISHPTFATFHTPMLPGYSAAPGHYTLPGVPDEVPGQIRAFYTFDEETGRMDTHFGDPLLKASKDGSGGVRKEGATGECFDFRDKKSCNRGDACRFVHVGADGNDVRLNRAPPAGFQEGPAKSKGKGGASKTKGPCYTCGGAHYARECPSGGAKEGKGVWPFVGSWVPIGAQEGWPATTPPKVPWPGKSKGEGKWVGSGKDQWQGSDDAWQSSKSKGKDKGKKGAKQQPEVWDGVIPDDPWLQYSAKALVQHKEIQCKYVKAGKPCPAPLDEKGLTTCV
jgi:hypothetical protein